MKDLKIFSFKVSDFLHIPFKQIRKSIYNAINHILSVVNLKIVPRQFSSLLNLLKAQTFCVDKPTEVFIFGKY